MTISVRQFRPQLWKTLLAIVVIAILVSLGNWQLSRAEQKEERQQKLDQFSRQEKINIPVTTVRPEEFQFRKVEARGTYVPEHGIILDNRIYKGMAGYQIVAPVRLENSSMHVLVNRGWIAADPDRSKLPDMVFPTGSVIISGIASIPSRTIELSAETVTGKVWANLDLKKYQEMTGLELQPVVILQQDELEDGLVRHWDRPDSGSAKNLGYAVQWYAMALAVFILYVVLSVRREHRAE